MSGMRIQCVRHLRPRRSVNLPIRRNPPVGMPVRTPRAEGGAGTSRAGPKGRVGARFSPYDAILPWGRLFGRHAPRAARVHRAPGRKAARERGSPHTTQSSRGDACSGATRRGRRGYVARRAERPRGSAGLPRARSARVPVTGAPGTRVFWEQGPSENGGGIRRRRA